MSLLAPGIDARPHLDVVLTALNAALAPNNAYTYDKVPGSKYMKTDGVGGKLQLPSIYAAVSVERRSVPARRNSGSAGRTSWRVSVRVVGTTVREAEWCALHVAAALNEARLTVDGTASSPVQHEGSTSPEWDDERWSGLAQYVYSI